jgi:hypothetical protein
VSKGTFNPPLWQLKTVTGKTDEFTLTAVNTTFSKPARLAYDAAQCVSDTVILSDKGGIRWKLKNGVLTAAVSRKENLLDQKISFPAFRGQYLLNYKFFLLSFRK